MWKMTIRPIMRTAISCHIKKVVLIKQVHKEVPCLIDYA